MAKKIALLESPPLWGGACHVASLIIAPQLCKQVFIIGGKEGHFAPLTCALHMVASLIITPPHWYQSFLCRWQGRSLRSTPRQGPVGGCHIGSSLIDFGTKISCVGGKEGRLAPLPAAIWMVASAGQPSDATTEMSVDNSARRTRCAYVLIKTCTLQSAPASTSFAWRNVAERRSSAWASGHADCGRGGGVTSTWHCAHAVEFGRL